MGGATAGRLVTVMRRRRSSQADREPVRAHSAGGVVLRGTGPERRVAAMRSSYGTWVLPKGAIEPGETPAEAARREVGEEVGLHDLDLVGPVGWTEHEFDLRGVHYRKRVDWFLFRAPASAEVHADPAERALDAGWFTRSQALRLLTHPDQRRILRRAWKMAGEG
jgi:8-oxo-dGTP pyrophosphatase MutT (NUDIX family)